MNYLQNIVKVICILLLVSLITVMLLRCLAWSAKAQSGKMQITGIDPREHPIVKVIVDFPGMISRGGIDSSIKECSFDIFENATITATHTSIKPLEIPSPKQMRLAFLLDLTSYEIEQGAKDEVTKVLTRLGNFCAWGRGDRLAIFVPDEKGEHPKKLFNWGNDFVEAVNSISAQWTAYVDGRLTLTDLDLLLGDIIQDAELSSIQASSSKAIILITNGLDRGDNLDVEKIRAKLNSIGITLYVLFWEDQADRAQDLINISSLLNNDPTNYYAIRNSKAVGDLLQKLVNPEMRFFISYTTTTLTSYELSLRSTSIDGEVSTPSTSVSVIRQPHHITIVKPKPASILTTAQVSPTITATLVITNPQIRPTFPYTLEYSLTTDNEAITGSMIYTAFYNPLQLPIRVNKILTTTKPLISLYSLHVRLHEKVTNLQSEASTYFTLQEELPVAPLLYWPIRKPYLSGILWFVGSLWSLFKYIYQTNDNIRLFLQLFSLLCVTIIAFIVWRWRNRYLDHGQDLDRTHDAIDSINHKLSIHQSSKNPLPKEWPGLPQIKAELIMLQGEGMLYDYIALTKPTTSLGSHNTNINTEEHWTLKNPYLDGIHCTIEAKDNGFWLYDGVHRNNGRRSKNGVYINGRKMEEKSSQLKAGDIIGLSHEIKYSFRVRGIPLAEDQTKQAKIQTNSPASILNSEYVTSDRLL